MSNLINNVKSFINQQSNNEENTMNSTVNDWSKWINNNYKSTVKSIKETNTYSRVSTTIESLPGSPEEKKVVGAGIGGVIVGLIISSIIS